ncbi:uncharacterized protein BJX67DRAFT_384531 [Aspergillus lucknowensis]|uniref:CFEM domain-containing protein n=1 Tax=Aspergillus lucknowensis TaxID=176173 RepID=A0ABR4LG53_9EURO
MLLPPSSLQILVLTLVVSWLPIVTQNNHEAFTIALNRSLVLAQSVSITALDAYQSQRPCARNCLEYGYGNEPGALAYAVECDSEPEIANNCLCRDDLQGDAVSYIRECVQSACEKDYDVTVAIDIYNDYCTSAGYTAGAITSGPTQTSGTPDPSATVTVTIVQTVFVGAAPRLSPETASQTTTESSESEETSSDSTASSTTSSPTDDTSNTITSTTTSTDGPPASTTSDGGDIILSSGGDGDDLSGGEIAGIVVGVLGFLATSATGYLQYTTHKRKKAAQAAP